MTQPTFAVWFRNDFRFHDHPALKAAWNAAEEHDGNLMFFFHLHPDFQHNTDSSNDYFFQTAASFKSQCEEAGLKLHILSGTVEEAFSLLAERTSSLREIFYIEDYTPFSHERDSEAFRTLEKSDIQFTSTPGSYIHEPDEIVKNDDTPYKVYTPFSRKWLQEDKPAEADDNHDQFHKRYHPHQSLSADGEKAFEQVLSSCSRKWQALGEAAALDRLEDFIDDRIAHYDKERDRPAVAGTSRLSPYIRTGALSVRRIYHAAADKGGQGAETFIKELAWRDFYAMIMYHFPETADQEFQEKFRSLEWVTSKENLQAWQEGRTGFPIVDAGMRQLNETGWMHNRLRMITASFLTKDYHIDWREGEAYFADKLIDHDPASNVGGWQWAASTGTDAVPYFRVFSPIRQSERFDPDGSFIRRYVTELADVPDKWIHEPHKMPEEEQQQASCTIGEDYPEPTVDHKLERKKAIEMYQDKGE
ncbi:cryptochrome/photolyase family protein [Alkalicoccus luteus]|uniref:cryptochrome/photolyase family protein n=1 Tax=Alkalicoccus luteus TaxID=1237094 RepID=UPI004034E569